MASSRGSGYDHPRPIVLKIIMTRDRVTPPRANTLNQRRFIETLALRGTRLRQEIDGGSRRNDALWSRAEKAAASARRRR